jgi:hypothetical protein
MFFMLFFVYVIYLILALHKLLELIGILHCKLIPAFVTVLLGPMSNEH